MVLQGLLLFFFLWFIGLGFSLKARKEDSEILCQYLQGDTGELSHAGQHRKRLNVE